VHLSQPFEHSKQQLLLVLHLHSFYLYMTQRASWQTDALCVLALLKFRESTAADPPHSSEPLQLVYSKDSSQLAKVSIYLSY